ncbi:DNA metabolism protein [Lithospermum erythrorhizon]|uniref:DNA metabolism protein n=1 Tax=Lithospermum erythrorhizon TaxID=34254 RepID=A0AAV3QD14_LITER
MINLSLFSSSSCSSAFKNPSITTPNKQYYYHTFSTNTSFLANPITLSISKTKKLSLKIKCLQSHYFEQNTFIPPQSSQTGPPRVFVGYSIYKGKAALTVDPRAPEFTPLDSGAYKLSKEGFVLLQFAPAAGVRQYDWSRKQVFSLSVTEMGSLISLGAKESCEFFHDPFKGKSDEGRVRKVLKVEPLPDGSGHFFNLSVQNKLINVDESIYIPVTKAEFTVLTSAFNFIVPYLIGWQTFANAMKLEDASRVNNVNPRSGGELEWSR